MYFSLRYFIQYIFHTIYRVLNKKVLLLLLFPFIDALSVNKPFRFIKPELVLPEYNILEIAEDHKGFIWLATQNGLCRYDGYDVFTYIHDTDDSTTISDNYVNAIFESKDSVLWIGTMSGADIYNRDKNSFIRLKFGYADADSAGVSVMDITEDNSGNIWVATRGGVFAWLKKEGKFFRFHCESDLYRKRLSNKFNAIVVVDSGVVLAGTTQGEIYKFNITKKACEKLKCINSSDSVGQFGEIKEMYKTSDGTVWVGTRNTGLIKIDKIEPGRAWYKQFTANPKTKSGISTNNILSFCELDSNKLLIGTENYGLNVLDKRNGKFTVYKTNNRKENSISGNSIWSIYKDHSDNIWIGIFDSGIDVMFSTAINLKEYKNNKCDTNSLSIGSVMSVAEDDKGNMWIGFDGSGLDYWDRKSNVFHHFEYDKLNQGMLLSNVPLCLLRSKLGDIWASFYNGGISVIDAVTEKYRCFSIEGGNSWLNVMDMVEDQDGKIYMATMGGGVNIYDPKTGVVEVLKKKSQIKNGLRSNSINEVFIDSKGNLWIGYVGNGVAKMYCDSTGKTVFENYYFELNNDSALSNNRGYAINEDKKGNVWIGTAHGLNKIDAVTGKVSRYINDRDLMSNVVVGIIPDDKGKIWISTYDGLRMFDPEEERFISYSEKGRLSSQRFNKRGAYYKSDSGEFFFGGRDGFLSFYPDSININEEDLKMYLSGFLLFNKPVSLNDPRSPLNKFITEADKITLRPGQSVFTIKYVALNYKNPEKIQYAYYLEGFENHWNYVGNKRDATYTNLDPGNYTFKVKYSFIDGVWNEKPITIQIEVLPPWWKTKTFYALSVLLILLIFIFYHKLRLRSLKRKRRILKEEVKERTTELREANEYLENQNEEILQQKEELNVQTENMAIVNTELEEKTEELLVYQERLEELVKERTAELEQAKEKAEESERLKTAFLANMSHEIRTPMNAVVGFSQLLRTDDLDDESKNMFISLISTNIDSLLALIDDILDLSKIESGQLMIVNKEFNLNILLEEVFANTIVSNKNDKIELRLKNTCEQQKLKLLSDRIRFKQILSNLLNNACKFTENGFVELKFMTNDSSLIFVVQDTGIGIPEDRLEYVFNRFRVIDRQRDKLYGGTGLGLAISQKLARMLGGEIKVTSVLNEGSVFTLILPHDIVV